MKTVRAANTNSTIRVLACALVCVCMVLACILTGCSGSSADTTSGSNAADSADSTSGSSTASASTNTFVGKWVCVAIDSGSGLVEVSRLRDGEISGESLMTLDLNKDSSVKMTTLGENSGEPDMTWSQSTTGVVLITAGHITELPYDVAAKTLTISYDDKTIILKKED